MREVLSPLLEGRIASLVEDQDPTPAAKYINDRLSSSWIYSPSPDRSSCQRQMLMETTPEEDSYAVPLYSGPPRGMLSTSV